MKVTEKALFELRADMARNPGGLERAELDYLLASIADESDHALHVVAELFSLDLESLEERAAILQYDGGLARVSANRLAVTYALQEFDQEITDRAAKWYFQNASAILGLEREKDWSRAETVTELQAYFQRHFSNTDAMGLVLLKRAG